MPKKIAMVVAFIVAGNANAIIILENFGTVKMGTEYHSNIQFLNDSVNESKSTYLTSIVPEYRLSAQDERNKWFGNIGINLVDSSNEDIMRNRQDPFGRVGWERTLENGLFNLDAEYRRESTRFSQFGQTGVLRQDGTSVERRMRALWKYNISEKWNISTEAGYDETKFSGVAILNSFSTRDIGAELMYMLNETVNPYVKIVAHDYRTSGEVGAAIPGVEDITRIKYQDYLIGAAVEMSPKLKFNAYTGIVNFDTSADNEWVGLIRAEYTGERYGLIGSLGRTILPVGLNQLLLQDDLSVNYKYLQSERSSWGIGVAITQSDIGLDTQELIGTYERVLNPDWIMSLSLASRNLKVEGAPSSDDTSLGIFFTYATPQFLK